MGHGNQPCIKNANSKLKQKARGEASKNERKQALFRTNLRSRLYMGLLNEPVEKRLNRLANGRNGRIVEPVDTIENLLTFLEFDGSGDIDVIVSTHIVEPITVIVDFVAVNVDVAYIGKSFFGKCEVVSKS